MTKALLTHVRAHANELGFAELGALSKRTVSRSLHDASDRQIAAVTLFRFQVGMRTYWWINSLLPLHP